nr:hypothetical protein [Tanacetum cinerariifolium]
MMVQAPKDMGEGSKIPTDPHHTPIVTQPSSSQPQKKKKSKRKQKKAIEVPSPSSEIPNEEELPITSNDLLPSQITLVDETHGRINEEDMFGVNNLDGDYVIVDVTTGENVEQSNKVAKKEVSTADPVTTAGEVVTTAVTVAGTRPKEKGIVIQEPSETHSSKLIDSSQQPSEAKDKGKGKMDNMQTKIDADCELAARLQEEERGESSIEEKSRLFVELMDKRKKHFARPRAKKIRIEGSEKAKEDSEKAKEGSSKRAGSNLEQEDAKRQRLEEENEFAELKRCLEIVLKNDDDVTIEATPISSKSPTIIDYKIYKEGT